MIKRSAKKLSLFFGSMQVRHDLTRATRSAVGFLGPLVLAETLHLSGDVTFAAIAAQNLAYFDIRGDYRMRLAVLGATTLVLTISAALGAAAGSLLLTSLLAAAIAGACMGLWRHLNNDFGPSLAATSMLLVLIGLETREFSAAAVGRVAIWTCGGALWGLLVQVALWPLRPEHPLRRTVADAWTAAGDLFTALGEPADKTGERHRRIANCEVTLRTTLDKTYVLLSAGRMKQTERMVERLRLLAEQAGQLALGVSGLDTALEIASADPALTLLLPAFQPIMTSLKNTAHTVALAVVSRQPSHLALAEVRVRRLTHLLHGFEARAASSGNSFGGRHVAELAAVLRAALAELERRLRATFERGAERSGISLELLELVPWRLQPLAAVLNLNRTVDLALKRFTVRITVLMIIGVAIFKTWEIPHGYWLPLTIIVVLQPDYGSTRQRAAQRFGGTLLGGAIASGLLWLQLPPAVDFTLMVLSLFFFGFFIPRNYGVAVIFVTLYVVLLTELHQTVTWTFTFERMACTIAGGVLALGAALLFWPVWERQRFPPILAAALEANRDYWRVVVIKLKSGEGFDRAMMTAKQKAEGANAILFSSLQRMMGDPKNQQEGLAQAAVLANGNQRLARAFGTVVLQHGTQTLRWRDEIARSVELVERILETLSTAMRTPEGMAERLRGFSAELEACDVALSALAAEPGDTTGQNARISRQLAPVFTELSGMLRAGAYWLDNGMLSPAATLSIADGAMIRS